MSWENFTNRGGSARAPEGSGRSVSNIERLSVRKKATLGADLRTNAQFPAINSPQRASGSRKKVVLEPGHSPLDWASLKSGGKNLRGIDASDFPMKVTKLELQKHNSEDDCWTTIKGKVYNITSYLGFHPGGVPEIMKCAGKDGTLLFNKYHPWVNVERILDGCWIGFYVG